MVKQESKEKSEDYVGESLGLGRPIEWTYTMRRHMQVII